MFAVIPPLPKNKTKIKHRWNCIFNNIHKIEIYSIYQTEINDILIHRMICCSYTFLWLRKKWFYNSMCAIIALEKCNSNYLFCWELSGFQSWLPVMICLTKAWMSELRIIFDCDKKKKHQQKNQIRFQIILSFNYTSLCD